jgi:chemotaxis signal transduction protein
MKTDCHIPNQTKHGLHDRLETEARGRNSIARSVREPGWTPEEESLANPALIGADAQWFCLFHADAGPMAISVDHVAEVLETETLIRMAWSPPQVAGMCSYRHEVVPVVKLRLVDDAGGADGSGSEARPVVQNDRLARCVVLILKTEQGAWGVGVESAKTVMSREVPEWHSPRISATGLVLTGTIRRGETRYEIVDGEATWLGLRSAISRWSGFMNESSPSSPPPSGEESISGRAGGKRGQ